MAKNKNELKIKGTVVLQKNLEAMKIPSIRHIVNQGGTRSSKTYSICQAFILSLLQATGDTLTISRKTMPALKTSAMRDFFEILRNAKLYEPSFHNKSDNTYILHGNLVEFMSLDQPQKKRGTKRKYLWLNEANEFTFEDYMQMSMRTTGLIVLDYNPSDEFHWIYDRIIPRKTTKFIHSTYKDNPFLEDVLQEEIEYLKEIDENYWRIYGLGEKGKSVSTIYTDWDIVPEFPENCDDVLYGMDFGYNNPSAVVKCGIKDSRHVYVQEVLYQTKLTNSDLIQEMKKEMTPEERDVVLIKADSAEPDRIEEFNNAGFWCEGCRKGAGSVKNGIDTVKRFHLHIVKDSPNVEKEIKGYKWRVDKDGHILDEPVKFKDHAMDAIRAAVGDMEEDPVTIIKEAVQGAERVTAMIGADRLSSEMEDF